MAVAFNGFDTLLAPFIKNDGLTYPEIKQSMQNFVFSVNSNSRAGAEPAFFNLTFDLTPPMDMLDEYAVIGGELVSFTYGSCQREMDLLNKAFFETMLEGDASGKLFAYPIPTYNIHSRFDWDNPNNRLLWEMAGKYGTPYFANFINSDLDITDVRSMCPLDGSTKIVCGIHDVVGDYIRADMTIEEAYRMLQEVPDGWFIVTSLDGKSVKARVNKFDIPATHKITLEDGRSYVTTANHMNCVAGKPYTRTDKLTLNDYITTDTGDVRITDISLVINPSQVSYCVEVLEDNAEPVFKLSNGIYTHNCRLRLDLSELRHRNGGLFGAGDSTGSIGVVTINLPRIAYEANGDREAFFAALDVYLNIAKDSLVIKREWLQKNVIDTHLIPAYMEYVGTLNNHFSTIGIVGMNEMCENLLGKNILDEEARQFSISVGEHIRQKLLEFQEETGHLYNYEATPAESTCYRFALGDKKIYPDIITQGSGKDCYYTNSCHIPVKLISNINDTFAHQDDLQVQFTGGTVIHCYLEGAIPGDHAKQIVKSMFDKYRVPYMSLSPISRYCDEHGYIEEHVEKCPYCKSRLKMFQRITGYLRCVDNFNRGKAAEFKDRTQLKE